MNDRFDPKDFLQPLIGPGPAGSFQANKVWDPNQLLAPAIASHAMATVHLLVLPGPPSQLRYAPSPVLSGSAQTTSRMTGHAQTIDLGGPCQNPMREAKDTINLPCTATS